MVPWWRADRAHRTYPAHRTNAADRTNPVDRTDRNGAHGAPRSAPLPARHSGTSAMRLPTRAAVSRSQMWAASWVCTGCHQSASRRGTAS